MRPARIGGLIGLVLGTAVAWAGSSALHDQARHYAAEGKPAVARQVKNYSDILGVAALGGVFFLTTLGVYSAVGSNPEEEQRRAEIDRQMYLHGGPPPV